MAFLESAAKERITGGRLYDAHIAEIARAAGARVVVTDSRRHFTILLRHDIRVLSAAEFLSEL
jgi:predicted nucleic acid-binding protein